MSDVNDKTVQLSNYFYYFILDGSFIDLAYFELVNILKAVNSAALISFSSIEETIRMKTFFLTVSKENFGNELIVIKNFSAFVKEIGILIYKTHFDFKKSFNENLIELVESVGEISWNRWLSKPLSFKVRLITIGNFVRNSKFKKKSYYKAIPTLGAEILKSSNSLVDVKNPFYQIDLVSWDTGNVLLGVNLYKINREIIEKRAPKHRKFFHPASMNPFLIRAMVNFGITKDLIKKLNNKKEIYFLDPFMGGGGMLLDALDLGFNAIGIDLEYWMGRGTRMNLTDFEDKVVFSKMPWNIISSSSQHLPLKENSINLIVTDPPYGVSTILKEYNFNELITFVLKESFRVLKKQGRIVISIPSNNPLPVFINKDQILFSVSNLVHRSLTRVIWVLQKN
jgi:putative methyltransferase (TIGR01177 family)